MTIKEFISRAIEGGWKVDDNDLEELAKHSWSLTDGGYLVTTINYKRVKMHHLILGKREGMEVDHINRDRLDNRRKNLRFVTRQQNAKNRGAGKGYRRKGDKFEAYIQSDRKWQSLGMYDTEEDASRAYLEAKSKMHAI